MTPLLLSLLTTAACQRPILPDLPDPRFVVLGPAGAGKSSLDTEMLKLQFGAETVSSKTKGRNRTKLKVHE